MTTKFLKMSKLLLLLVFYIVGIISCSADTTQPNASQENTIILPKPGDTGPVTPGNTNSDTKTDTPDTDNPGIDIPDTNPDNPETGGGTEEPKPPTPEKPTFDGGYYELYVPFTTWRENSGFVTNVYWQDTNTLNNLWKELIDGGKNNDGKRWMIRDGDNHSQSDPRTGNYYYFDKNFDIVHAGKYANRLRVKQFLGGVIVRYSGGRSSGTWTVGGLYKTLLNKETYNSEGQQGYTKYNNDNLNEFMRAIHRWEEGDLSVILMNVGYDDVHQNEFGVDEYYCTVDDNYRKDPSYFIGMDPDTYTGPAYLNVYWNEKLNVRVNHSWNLWKFNFRFFYGDPYPWHLQ